MNGKTQANSPDFLAEKCACLKGGLYVYSQYSAVFGRLPGESTPRLAAVLGGNGKTNRPATVVAHRAGLTNANTGGSHG